VLPPQQQGLLQLNRQTRQEAIQLYYKENEFEWHFNDFDMDLWINWCQSSRDRKKSNTIYKFRGKATWANILHWFKGFYDNKAPSVAPRKDRLEGDVDAIARLFMIIKRLKKLSVGWEEIGQQLECMHLALAAVVEDWE
jgi:hypothetical protein